MPQKSFPAVNRSWGWYSDTCKAAPFQLLPRSCRAGWECSAINEDCCCTPFLGICRLNTCLSPTPFSSLQCTPYKAVIKKKWCNQGLRDGLGLLSARPAASEADEGCGPVASRDGRRYVLTQLGGSLWHSVMRHLLSSEGAAAQIPAYFTIQEPPELGATDKWEKNGATCLNAP